MPRRTKQIEIPTLAKRRLQPKERSQVVRNNKLSSILKSQEVRIVTIPRREVAPIIKNSLTLSPHWLLESAGMRFMPKAWAIHTELRLPSTEKRQRLRLDLVAVVRWSMKRPKSIFGIEIKSCLADFEADNKWLGYLEYCDYFCFACPSGELELLRKLDRVLPKSVGVLEVDMALSVVKVRHRPEKIAGGKTPAIYENLYERAMGWSGSDSDRSEESRWH